MTKQTGICLLCIGNDLVSLNRRCSRLKELGWDVICSGSGHDGLLQFAQQQPIHLVVLDLDHDGAENALIAAQVKRHHPRLPVIMLVGDRETLVPGATDQADAVVPKAEEEPALSECIRELLGNL